MKRAVLDQYAFYQKKYSISADSGEIVDYRNISPVYCSTDEMSSNEKFYKAGREVISDYKVKIRFPYDEFQPKIDDRLFLVDRQEALRIATSFEKRLKNKYLDLSCKVGDYTNKPSTQNTDSKSIVLKGIFRSNNPRAVIVNPANNQRFLKLDEFAKLPNVCWDFYTQMEDMEMINLSNQSQNVFFFTYKRLVDTFPQTRFTQVLLGDSTTNHNFPNVFVQVTSNDPSNKIATIISTQGILQFDMSEDIGSVDKILINNTSYDAQSQGQTSVNPARFTYRALTNDFVSYTPAQLSNLRMQFKKISGELNVFERPFPWYSSTNNPAGAHPDASADFVIYRVRTDVKAYLTDEGRISLKP